jgi:hypothetical protein
MMADDMEDLHQKINKKFIRNVIKPIEQMQRRADDLPFQIPSASELFGYPMSGPPLPHETQPRGGSLPVPRHPREEYGEDESNPFQPAAYSVRRPYVNEAPPLPRRRMIRPSEVEEGYLAPPRAPPRATLTPIPTPIPTPPPPTPAPINCVTICAHVQSCPVCSQLYRPYTGIYLAVIVILIIVILFLLKKIFQF